MSRQGHFVFRHLSLRPPGRWEKEVVLSQAQWKVFQTISGFLVRGVRSLFYWRREGWPPWQDIVVCLPELLSDRCELGGDTGCGRGQNSSLVEFICNVLHIRDTLQKQNTPIVSVRHVNTELWHLWLMNVVWIENNKHAWVNKCQGGTIDHSKHTAIWSLACFVCWLIRNHYENGSHASL